jgi:hypothetical protein
VTNFAVEPAEETFDARRNGARAARTAALAWARATIKQLWG